MLKHLIKIEDLSASEIENISQDALAIKQNFTEKTLLGKNICLMFFENSTRTKISFEVAAKKLGANVINFETTTSSINKGETLRDTIENLYFIGIDAVVIRTSDDDLIANLCKEVRYPMHFINAGSGKASHPTQALLDYVTMKEKIGSIVGKKIVIIGDVEHSRVAKSNIALWTKFGANVVVCAPEYFKSAIKEGCIYTSDMREAIADADVIMGLRIQKERILEAYSEDDYIDNYQLNSNLLEKYAPQAILMHPGPVNREVEITSELLDSSLGETILEQARNGVYTRMAVLQKILGDAK